MHLLQCCREGRAPQTVSQTSLVQPSKTIVCAVRSTVIFWSGLAQSMLAEGSVGQRKKQEGKRCKPNLRI